MCQQQTNDHVIQNVQNRLSLKEVKQQIQSNRPLLKNTPHVTSLFLLKAVKKSNM